MTVEAAQSLPFLAFEGESEGPSDSTHRMVIDLVMLALAVELPPAASELEPGFFSNSFQNLRDSSAAVEGR
ncbi:hypothetical protein LTR60_000725, partial [Cryomyces antarcticus]